jgi:hypothetical protein
MLPYGLDYLVGKDRQTERLREAERRRLASQIRKDKGSNRLSFLLIWLGRRLVIWGRYLEEGSAVRHASREGSRC